MNNPSIEPTTPPPDLCPNCRASLQARGTDLAHLAMLPITNEELAREWVDPDTGGGAELLPDRPRTVAEAHAYRIKGDDAE